jgi:hypothetical protein
METIKEANVATQTALKDVLEFVATRAGTHDLNAIVDILKMRRNALSYQALAKFRRGDRVAFKGRSGQTISGTVERVMQKNVRVKSDGGGTWRVPAHMLSAA